MILTPGVKRRFLRQLHVLIRLVEKDQDRDVITHRTAELMPTVANSFAFYTPPKRPR